MRLAVPLLFLFLLSGCLRFPHDVDSGCSRPCHIYLESNETPSCISSDGPIACTLEYRLGDACLRYVGCDNSDGTCATTLDPRFDGCISCYRQCIAEDDGSVEGFDRCENRCAPKFA